ncbi:MAG: hypothetical protein NT133_16315 [Alphaproteobacteria bacterium]|nr:hypothetical protein [Alphaproteobacteria bacterium]
MRRAVLGALAALLLLALPQPGLAQDRGAEIDAAIHTILADDEDASRTAFAGLRDWRDMSAVAPLIQLLFWTDEPAPVVETLEALTGAKAGETFFDWMVWQQDHPEIRPYAGYAALFQFHPLPAPRCAARHPHRGNRLGWRQGQRHPALGQSEDDRGRGGQLPQSR